MKDRIECRCIKCDNVFTHVFQGVENPSQHRPRPIECPKCGSIELEYNMQSCADCPFGYFAVYSEDDGEWICEYLEAPCPFVNVR